MPARTTEQNTDRYAVREAAAATAAAAPISEWGGWVTVAWADAYHGPTAAAPTAETGVALVLQWGSVSDAQKTGAIRHASFRLACCNWQQSVRSDSEFPWFEPDDAPDEILAAVSELALHYLRHPERRFEVIGADTERDVAGNQFGFRYSWAKDFYGDLPATVMGMVQRFIETPSPAGMRKQQPDDARRMQRLNRQPGWGRRTGGP